MLVAHIANSLIHLGALLRCNIQVTAGCGSSHDSLLAELEPTLILHHHEVVEGVDAEGRARAARPVSECIDLVSARVPTDKHHLRDDFSRAESFPLVRIERSKLATADKR